MKAFIDKYEDRIHGVLSCFDRMLFRGYLPIMSGWQMAQFFNSSGIRFRELKAFLGGHAERVERHAVNWRETRSDHRDVSLRPIAVIWRLWRSRTRVECRSRVP
jgi:hypothetical protein